MKKQQQQNLAMLFLISFSLLTVSRNLPSNGSNWMDFLQGTLTGMGIVSMLLTIITFGRYYKRSQ